MPEASLGGAGSTETPARALGRWIGSVYEPPLTHALLSEDEAVLLEGLNPTAGDRILALFARGNGDAALALLQSAPAQVFLYDLFDSRSLAAQFQLKRWLYTHLDNDALRRFVGLSPCSDPGWRRAVAAEAMRHLSPPCRRFWSQRSACLFAGMAGADSMARWGRLFRAAVAQCDTLEPRWRRVALRCGLLLAPFFFPREERRCSRGYRQMVQNPEGVVRRLAGRDRSAQPHGYIPYGEFNYLRQAGHAAIRRRLDQVVLLPRVPPPVACNRIYCSNVIDYMPGQRFRSLLDAVIPRGPVDWTALINSTYASNGPHPALLAGIREGQYRIDWPRTRQLRARDRIGVYAGLTIITTP